MFWREIPALPRCVVGVVLVAVTAMPAVAQIGPEFQVNTYTTGGQYRPAVAIDAAGKFMVVWEDFHNGDYDIQARFFDASGTPLAESMVNTYTTGDQIEPVVARLSSGFVVIWESDGPDGDAFGIFGQRYDANAAAVGGEFQVNTYTTGNQALAAVSGDGSGNFVVIWENQYAPGGNGIFGQRFASNGSPIGGEFAVTAFTTGYQVLPSVAMNPNGSFVVVWSDYGGLHDVFGQRFDSAGARVGGEFQVNTSRRVCQPGAHVAGATTGNFVVVWNSDDNPCASGPLGETDVFGQRFDASAARLGGEFQVNTYTTGIQYASGLATDGNGNFVVTWSSYYQDGDLFDAFTQAFSASGARLGSEFQVNTYTTYSQDLPVIAVDNAGHFVVAWESYGQDGDGYGIFAQRYASPSLARAQLNFGVSRSGGTLNFVTPPQQVAITVVGAWTAVSDQPFISVTPSGTGSGLLTVQIAGATGLPASGAAPTATITVIGAGASSPQAITVNTQVYATGTTTASAGFFDTPANNATGVAGAIAVTGWALDDIGVGAVKLYRDPVSADPPGAIGSNGKVYIADALFVADQRSDIEAGNPTAPLNYRGAWGYMLLTNFLPSGANPVGGNGPFTFYAYAFDVDGHMTPLGSKTITVDNQNATKPFGTIDTPAQGAVVSGGLDNFGWALTPGTATIPTDGSTVQVFVDGTFLGTAAYNLPRSDIQTAFPGYTNSGGPVGVFHIDTTTLTNGVHTIFWIVTDDQARADGIGSRFFSVLN